MLPAILIGAGAGLLKSKLVDAPREERERELAAKTQLYSPWTGLKANPIQEADPLGSAMQGGIAGAQFGAGLQQQEDIHNWLSRGFSPFAGGLTSGPGPGAFVDGPTAMKSMGSAWPGGPLNDETAHKIYTGFSPGQPYIAPGTPFGYTSSKSPYGGR